MLALVAGCKDFHAADIPGDAAVVTPDAPGQMTLAPCLDRPTDLARPPTGQLSCDLLPPGFK